MSKRVRIALELDERLAVEVDRVISRMNQIMAPLQVTRAGLIRDAIEGKLAELKSKVPGL